RMLMKRPGFTLIAVITLALGIGLKAALFSGGNGLILRPLPYREPDPLAPPWQRDMRPGVGDIRGSDADFPAPRPQARAFASLTAHNVHNVALDPGEGAVDVSGVFVASNFFATLGAALQLGRAFTPEEEQPVQGTSGGAAAVVIISHQFWQSRLGGRVDVI